MLVSDSSLPRLLYTAADVRELDRIAIENHGIPGITLMQRAGRAAFERLQQHWPETPLTIYCGTGNNGGDGFVIAGLAAQQRIPVTLCLVGDAGRVSGDAALARDFALDNGVAVQSFAGQTPTQGVVIDAVLGTGFSGALRPLVREAVETMNSSGLPVLAIDTPSGLSSDTGAVADAAVRADATISFIGLKRGLFTGAGPAYAGAVWFDDLRAPEPDVAAPVATARRLLRSAVSDLLPPRTAIAHKGSSGHVLVVGGNHGFGGAALLAASAAARSGAGLTSCATRRQHAAGMLAARPEVMVHPVDDAELVAEDLVDRASVVAVGPGLGSDEWARSLLRQMAALAKPLVVDADALNLIAAGVLGEQPNRDRWVLTPHPGEAARLLDVDTATVQADRFAAVSALQHRYGGVVVLKGAGTLIADGGPVIDVADYAQPALASGGTGDVLTGIIAALIAQGLALADAARLAVCVHAEAAAVAAMPGVRGTLAMDVIDALRGQVN